MSLDLAPRNRPRPTTSIEGPHRQLDGQSSAEVWRGLVAQASALAHVETGRSQISPASTIALFFDDLDTAYVESTNLSPGNRLEPVHIHGMEAVSYTHLFLKDHPSSLVLARRMYLARRPRAFYDRPLRHRPSETQWCLAAAANHPAATFRRDRR